MLVPLFSLRLQHRVLPRLVTVGRYDGRHATLTCATTGDRVLLHCPHRRLHQGGRLAWGASGDVSLLSINQQVTAMATGRMREEGEEDTLVVGTHTSVLAYDVEANSDVFFHEANDGANAVVVGRLGSLAQPLALVGGNCSIAGLDKTGKDVLWTVTGDNVRSLALVDFDGDGDLELLAGSDDFDIRVFREDAIIAEMPEAEVVTALAPLGESRFGYALANGTVGVYEHALRYWRIKSKNEAVAITGVDASGDGVAELVTGWNNGKVDARNDHTGEVVFKESLGSALAGVVLVKKGGMGAKGGPDTLLVVARDGEVRGLALQEGGVEGDGKLSPGIRVDDSVDQEMLREMMTRRQTLLLELRNYEDQGQMTSASGVGSELMPSHGVIPANTQLQTTLTVRKAVGSRPPHIELMVTTTNNTLIHSVLLFAEGIFQEECYVVHPRMEQRLPTLEVRLVPPRDAPLDLHIKALVGRRDAQLLHVFELTRQLPRFSMYLPCTEAVDEPLSFVSMVLAERVQRVVLWLNQNFLLAEDLPASQDLHLTFVSLRGSGPLCLSVDKSGQTEIRTDDMELAGNIVQSLTTFLHVNDLMTKADFPLEMEALRELLDKVQDYQAVRQKLSSEMADHSNLIRAMVVQVENARILGDVASMRRGYAALADLNRDLMSGFRIRCSNHLALLSCLRQLNLVIQRAARLRVGRHQTQLITACRAALRSNCSVDTLYKIIQFGVGTPQA